MYVYTDVLSSIYNMNIAVEYKMKTSKLSVDIPEDLFPHIHHLIFCCLDRVLSVFPRLLIG
jgi:hypothetical protein